MTRTTTLNEWHRAHGAKMVEFGGYDMPVQYALGIISEHTHTRHATGFFDVSHMGHIIVRGAAAIEKFENLVPADVKNLKVGQMRYTLLLNEWGGVIDDLMMARPDDSGDVWLVVNAGCKEKDMQHLRQTLGAHEAEVVTRDLIALQGPKAASIMARYVPELPALGFMQACWTKIQDIHVMLMRSGYTGEDGFEISVPPEKTIELANLLLSHEEVKPVGLGARDTLRLEAGLCLYGHELSEKVTPIEAGLNWAINKAKLSEAEFAGASIIESMLLNKPERVRVGLMIDDRTPARDGVVIHTLDGENVGIITSGGFSPTLNHPIAMAYIDRKLSVTGTKLHAIVRGKAVPCHVTPLPFVPHRYFLKK
jgi:aminomethyltransferase